MITEDLITYIQEQRRKNVPDDTITSRLADAGWHADDIAEAFQKLAPQVVNVAPVVPKIEPVTYVIPENKVIQPKKEVVTPTPTQLEVRSEELMPKLEPKITPLVLPMAPPISPISPKPENKIVSNLPQAAILHSYQQALSSASESNTQSFKKKRNTVLKWLIIILIISAIGGASFAVAGDYIKIPFLSSLIKKDPKVLLLKAPLVLNSLKSYKIETTATLSMPLFADITSGLVSGETVSSSDKDSISINAKGMINNNQPSPTFDYLTTIKSSMVKNDIVMDLKYSNTTAYVTIPNLSQILGSNAPGPSTVAIPKGGFNSFIALAPTNIQDEMNKIDLDKVLSIIVPSYVTDQTASVLKDFVNSGSVIEKAQEDIHGVPTYHYELSAPRVATKKLLNEFIKIFVSNLSPEEQANLDDKLGAVTMDSFSIWIGKNDSNIHQYRFNLTAPLSKIIGLNDQGIAGSQVSLSFQTSYYDFDVPNTILLPSDTITVGDYFNKINDMKIKNSISSFKSVADTLHNALGNYGKGSNSAGSCASPSTSSLFSPVGHTKGASTVVGTIASIITSLLNRTGGELSCYSNSSAWALSAPLTSDANTFFCADSTGATLSLPTGIKGTVCK